MAVSAGAIRKGLDVLVDLGRRQCPSSVDTLLDPLLLHAAEKGFGHRVVPAVAPSTHAGF